MNNVAMEEKFINTIIFANQGSKGLPMALDSPVFKKWQQQVNFNFVSPGDQIMPDNPNWCYFHSFFPIEMNEIVRGTEKPKFS